MSGTMIIDAAMVTRDDTSNGGMTLSIGRRMDKETTRDSSNREGETTITAQRRKRGAINHELTEHATPASQDGSSIQEGIEGSTWYVTGSYNVRTPRSTSNHEINQDRE